MNIRYRVELDQPERDQLGAMLRGGKQAVRKLKRAQILLSADAGVSDEAIAVAVSGSTVYRTKRRFVELGLDAALSEEPRARGAAQTLRQGGGPAGGHRLLQLAAWPLPLDLGGSTRNMSRAWRTCSISMPMPPIRRGRWRVSTKAPPSSSAKYARRSPPDRESSNATAARTSAMAPPTCWSSSMPTAHGGTSGSSRNRAAADFAHCMRDLADIHYPQAGRIRVALDYLSTHTPAALYQTLPAPDAAAWRQQRNASGASINWMFSTDKARTKPARAYPKPTAKES